MNIMIAFRLKNILHSRQFQVTSLLVLLLSIISFSAEAIKIFGQHTAYIYSATYMWSLINKTESVYKLLYNPFLLMLMPLFAAYLASSDIYDERKNGVSNIIITRSNRRKYYISSLIAILIVTFAVFFVTLFLNQLLWLVAVPVKSHLELSVMPQYEFEGLRNINYISLFLNHPLCYNLVYSLIISAMAAAIAAFSYAISFFVKMRFLILTLPAVMYITSGFILETLGLTRYTIANVIYVIPSVTRPHVKVVYIVIIILLAFSFGVVLRQSKDNKDEL